MLSPKQMIARIIIARGTEKVSKRQRKACCSGREGTRSVQTYLVCGMEKAPGCFVGAMNCVQLLPRQVPQYLRMEEKSFSSEKKLLWAGLWLVPPLIKENQEGTHVMALQQLSFIIILSHSKSFGSRFLQESSFVKVGTRQRPAHKKN